MLISDFLMLTSVCVLLICAVLMIRMSNLCSIYYWSAEQHWHARWSDNSDSEDSWRTGNTRIKELTCTDTARLLPSGGVLSLSYFTVFCVSRNSCLTKCVINMFGFVLFVKLVDYQLAVFLNINTILTLTLVNTSVHLARRNTHGFH